MPHCKLCSIFLLAFILSTGQPYLAEALVSDGGLKRSDAKQVIFAQAPSQPSRQELERQIQDSEIERQNQQPKLDALTEQSIKNFESTNSRIVKSIRRDGCNESDARLFIQNLNPMLTLADLSLKSVKALTTLIELGSSDASNLQRENSLYRRLITVIGSAQLDFADAALHRKCLDWADRIYRAYATAAGTTSITRRALIGVDDVRAARNR